MTFSAMLFPVPLKLRPYDTSKNLFIIIIIFFIPQVVKIPGVKNKKAKIIIIIIIIIITKPQAGKLG